MVLSQRVWAQPTSPLCRPACKLSPMAALTAAPPPFFSPGCGFITKNSRIQTKSWKTHLTLTPSTVGLLQFSSQRRHIFDGDHTRHIHLRQVVFQPNLDVPPVEGAPGQRHLSVQVGHLHLPGRVPLHPTQAAATSLLARAFVQKLCYSSMWEFHLEHAGLPMFCSISWPGT